MKRSPLKEFIISSLAATIAGYIVKKGYDYFQENELPKVKEANKDPQEKSLLDSAKGLINRGVDKAEAIKDESPAQQGLIATMAYALTVFTVTKMLRKVI